MLTALFCTVVVGFVFLRMSISYTRRRTDRRYAEGKNAAPSIRSFRHLSKLLFTVSMVLTLASYWIDGRYLLPLFSESPWLKTGGAMLVLSGYLGLSHAFRLLGEHYSPMFDAFLPDSLVQTGLYRLVRHPVYLFNLFVSFGLAISSASGIVLISATIGLLFVLRAISMEEAYLERHFPDYADYMKRSWRLVPYVY